MRIATKLTTALASLILIHSISAQTPGAFGPTASMAIPRASHTTTLLTNGKVLIAGGVQTVTSQNGNYVSLVTATAELYDPATGTFTPTGSMSVGRYWHAATLLADGRVLITGGENQTQTLNTAEIYDPATGSFSLIPMLYNHYYHQSVLLNNGQVLVVGGSGSNGTGDIHPELFNPQTASFSSASIRPGLGGLGLSEDGIAKINSQHRDENPQKLREFLSCLHFYLGEASFRQLQQLVEERMEHVGLKHDANALAVAVDIVRTWIRGKQGDITIDVLEKVLKDRDLLLPKADEPCSTIYLSTIAEGAFDLEPDFVLDWRKYFPGPPHLKGHRPDNPSDWNDGMLPELRNVLGDVRKTTRCRLVRARGLARLSAWLAFGYTFSEVAGFTIEVQQQDEHWRTDVPPAKDFVIQTTSAGGAEGERITGSGSTVACGVSVTGSLDSDVREHISTLKDEQVAGLLLLRPERTLGRDCLRGAADAVALARGVKEILRPFVKQWNATRLLFYYFGPLSGACFIGHQLNAVCRTVQVMEDQQPGYAPSFLVD